MESNNVLTFKLSASIKGQGGFCCGTDNPYLLISRARNGAEID
jgi:hypothetical protein